MAARIAIIEDEEKLLDLLVFNLKEEFEVEGFLSAEAFLSSFQKNDFSIVISDVRLPGIDGIELMKRIRRERSSIPVIIMTAFASINQAVAAIKEGAYDYLTKPVTLKKMKEILSRAVQFNANVADDAPPFPMDHRFLTAHTATREQLNLAARVAPKKVPVLILGETGTGKEIIAELIHNASSRKGNLVKINCAAIPGELLEGELFGYRKGAFTGAHESHEGKLRLADKGTLFLDEIAEMPDSLQAKLLRVLENETFYPIGENRICKVDIRIIAATNKDLNEGIASGRFRADLYYRLAVVPIRIPPLRERKEDIPIIAQRFLEENIIRGETDADTFEASVMSALYNYDWPGNVRELRNIVTHMALLSSGGRISINDLPAHLLNRSPEVNGVPKNYEELKELKKAIKNEAVTDVEKQFLLATLTEHNWNISKSAQAVKMDRRLFQNMMKKLGIRRRS